LTTGLSDLRLSPAARLAFAAALLAACLAARPAAACTVFALSQGDTIVVGRNLDIDEPLPGAVLVNPRGVTKSLVPWRGYGPVAYEGEVPSWTSRLGSVTFTCWGRDFIESGMNERGLVVAEANLPAEFPPDDGRPGASCAQWMQYLLDTCATVDEALAHAGDLRVDGEDWHFMLTDSAGDCAVVEFIDGRAVAYRGNDLPHRAMTNSAHVSVTGQLPLDVRFGGEVDIGAGDDSYGRFVRVAALMRDIGLLDCDGTADCAFHILDSVATGETARSVVYDTSTRRVVWKTPGGREPKWLDLASVRLDDGSPTVMVAIETGMVGDATVALEQFSEDALRSLAGRHEDRR